MLVSLALFDLGCRGAPTASNDLNIAIAVFPSEAARYRNFAADFELLYHARVNIVAQNYGDILQAMLVQGSGRGTLDICELDLAMLGEARPAAQNLDELLNADATELFTKEAWRAATFDGHTYFVPHRLMWQAMIYNRVEVPKPPATWSELQRFVHSHPNKLAFKAARYEGAVCDASSFIWASGGDLCEPISSGSLGALSYLRLIGPDLNDESGVFRETSVLEAQARGSVWIHFNWPFAMAYLHEKGLAPGVDMSATIPRGPDGTATPLGGGYLAIPRFAPHAATARAFIKYLLTREAQQRLSRDLGWYGSVPPTPGSEDEQLYSGFIAMRSDVRARPSVPCYPELSDQWRRAIRSVLLDNQAPAEAVADAFDDSILPASPNGNGNRCACAGRSR
ncbi:MAG: ABC-type sugar transport system, periplasmic component [Candidatus Binatus sp.]|nr:ABC-type sugar transport system, periplasmic component [Candidatus Binatus sp.]